MTKRAGKSNRLKQNEKTMLAELRRLLEEGRFGAAEEQSRKMETMGFDSADFWCDRAYLGFKKNDYVNAIECLEQALTREPDHGAAKSLLARICFLEQREEDGKSVIRDLLERMPDRIPPEDRAAGEAMLAYYQPKTAEEAARQEAEERVRQISYFDLLQFSEQHPAAEYQAYRQELQDITVRRLRRKRKIKLAFVLYDASMWCGDDLYFCFKNDPRYEVKVYLCLRQDSGKNNALSREDFRYGLERMRSHGIEVTAIEEPHTPVAHMDVLLYLIPYDLVLPDAFQLRRLNLSTLTAYIPYGLGTCLNDTLSNISTVITAWKVFLDSSMLVDEYQERAVTGLPQGEASGHPRADYYFRTHTDRPCPWKQAKEDAIRILYAPHWSIDGGVRYATFQYNYRFFYEYARDHQETSWIVKPHPNLCFSAVEAGIFPSEEAFEDYLDAWDDLPNARVAREPYYQEIFETSDGMILDSASFVTEYQYTHKPLLFLERDSQGFSKMGQELMKHLYRVDGRDLYGIARFISRVLIQGKDDARMGRMAFFDQVLDYQKMNGILASEAIYRSIATALLPEDDRKKDSGIL